jgi:hypothetical protein
MVPKIQGQCGMLTKGVVLLPRTKALIRLFNWEIFDHPPYNPDLAPIDYPLFTKMKVWLATQRFHRTKNSWMESTIGCIMWRHSSLTRDYKN